MDTLEIVATSLDEARQQAATQLGIEPDAVVIKVLEETKGLFGRPGKLRVEASAGKAKAVKKAPAKKAKEEAPVAEVEEAAPAEKPAKGRGKAAKATEEVAEEAPAKPKGRGKKAEATTEAGSEEEKPARPEVIATQEDADNIVAIIDGLMETADLDAQTNVTEVNGRYINLEIDGKDVGYLVGRRGEVLNALQYIANVIASRKLQPGVRIVLEGDNYRKRREEVLTELATNIAKEVKSRGEEAVLDALPAFERRIVHQALVEFDGVTTYSEGEEPSRRVVIAPAE